jgi:PEP-CTERM motif
MSKRAERRRLQHHLAGYAAAAGAVLAVHTEASDASVIYSGPMNITLDSTGTYELDMNGDSVTDFSFSHYTGNSVTHYTGHFPLIGGGFATSFTTYSTQRAFGIAIGSNAQIATTGALYIARRLAAGDAVAPAAFSAAYLGGILGYHKFIYSNHRTVAHSMNGATISTFQYQLSSHTITAGEFLGRRGFLAVDFSFAGQLHYGWIDIQMSEHADVLTIYGWAYEDVPDTGLSAGEIPEPASLATLALGAAGIVALRRRRRGNAA